MITDPKIGAPYGNSISFGQLVAEINLKTADDVVDLTKKAYLASIGTSPADVVDGIKAAWDEAVALRSAVADNLYYAKLAG